MAQVLFVCLENAGRSQMSQALFTRAVARRASEASPETGAPPAHTARSAGTAPAERIHPEVVRAMAELGIDLSERTPNGLTREMAERADLVVTMGCGDECPYVPGTAYLDWDLPDPKGMPLDEVRGLRDEIDRRVESLVAELESG